MFIGMPDRVLRSSSRTCSTASRAYCSTEADKREIQEAIDKLTAEIAVAEKAEDLARRKAAHKEVLISYAHKDMTEVDYVDELRAHLITLERAKKIKWWDDLQIKPSEKWDAEIKKALAKAKVAVMLVSANFFRSDYIWDEEYSHLLQAAEEEGAAILWVPVSACLYDDMEISKYQAVGDPKKPLAMLTHAARQEVYTELARRIKGIHQSLALTKPSPRNFALRIAVFLCHPRKNINWD